MQVQSGRLPLRRKSRNPVAGRSGLTIQGDGEALRPAILLGHHMEYYKLTLGVLSVWRITHLMHSEDGPWDMIVKLRRFVGEGVLGKMMDCFYCLSFWIALPFGFVLAESWSERMMLWLSLSAGAIICQKILFKEV